MTSVSTSIRLIIALTLLMLMGCAGISVAPAAKIKAITAERQIRTTINISKSLFDSRTGTFFLLQKDTHQVQIWRNGSLMNSIGGLGQEKEKFLRLSDIALDIDGSLLCLDSIAREIKKFSSDGVYQSDYSVSNINQPELLCVGGDQAIYIYDSSAQEIVLVNSLTEDNLYRFGRFQLQRVSSLSCSRSKVCAYMNEPNKTAVFSSFGDYLGLLDGMVMYDLFDNRLVYNGQSIKACFGDDESLYENYPISTSALLGSVSSLVINDRYLIFSNNQICQSYRIEYLGTYE